jgi:5-methylcytosine-specific restriction endonuclease McrA
MRIELILFFGAAFIIANIYTEGKYFKKLFEWKKYYQMIGVAIGAFIIYWLIKKDPRKAKDIIITSNEYLKYLPIDQNSSRIISPVLDFTGGALTGAGIGGIGSELQQSSNPIVNMFSSVVQNPEENRQKIQENRMMQSGKKATKRSVSETKKKYVAARQNWKCGDCNNQLTAWFEVDHKIRLEYGGSNHIDNLVALCRECHGKKTTIENL